MAERKKRLRKQIEGLRKVAEEHRDKLKNENVSEIIKDYWMKEIEEYERQADEREEMLKKLED